MVFVEVSFLAFGVVDTKLPVAQEVTKIAQAIKNITLFIAFFIVVIDFDDYCFFGLSCGHNNGLTLLLLYCYPVHFPPQKYHPFARKYSVISKICSVSAKNMTDRLNFED